MTPFGLVLATPGDRTVVTGLTLAERGRRVLVRAGLSSERVRAISPPATRSVTRRTARGRRSVRTACARAFAVEKVGRLVH